MQCARHAVEPDSHRTPIGVIFLALKRDLRLVEKEGSAS